MRDIARSPAAVGRLDTADRVDPGLTSGVRDIMIPTETALESLHLECAELCACIYHDDETAQHEPTQPGQVEQTSAQDLAPAQDPRLTAILEKQKFIEEFNVPKLREMAQDQEAYLRGLKRDAAELSRWDRFFTDLDDINETQQKDAQLSAKEYSGHADYMERQLEHSRQLAAEALLLEEQAEHMTLLARSQNNAAMLENADQLFVRANDLLERSYEAVSVKGTPDSTRRMEAYKEISSELHDTIDNLGSSITGLQAVATAGKIAENFLPGAGKGVGFVGRTAIGFLRSVAVNETFGAVEEIGHVAAGSKSSEEAFGDFVDKSKDIVQGSAIGTVGGLAGVGVAAKFVGQAAEGASTVVKVTGNLVEGASSSATQSVIRTAATYQELQEDFSKSVEGQTLSVEERESMFEQYLEQRGFTLGEIASNMAIDTANGAVGRGIGLGKSNIEGRLTKEVSKVALGVGENVLKRVVGAEISELKENV